MNRPWPQAPAREGVRYRPRATPSVGGGRQACTRALHGTAALIALVLIAAGIVRAQVADTKHNLSVTGPGTIKASTETEICKFCHTPHNVVSREALWGHRLSDATYAPYTSQTLSNAVPAAIGGSSKLCLSCHDGQVAVNALGNATPALVNGVTYLSGASRIGTSLVADHPVSFQPVTTGNAELVNPPAGSALEGRPHLDDGGYLQCTSCHDPHKHNRDPVTTKFLVAANNASALCLTCHQKRYWGGASAHGTSIAVFTAAQGQHTGYTTVNSNGCESCHAPHQAGQAAPLLNGAEEATCTGCHAGAANGGNTRVNVSNVADGPFAKVYRHPTYSVSGKHQPRMLVPRTNSPTERQGDLNAPNRHAECADCHNPHAAGTRTGASGNHYGGTGTYPSNATAGSLDLTGVWGVEPPATAAWTVPGAGNYVLQDPSTKEYQICFKCHASFAYGVSPPSSPSMGTNAVTTETDQAMEFNPANASYHAVVGTPVAGVQGYYAGAVWGPTSQMYCSDCHGEDDANTGWTVPATAGPHGSNNPFILRGAWDASTGQTTPTHLCFRCHDYNGFVTGVPSKTKFSTGNYAEDLHRKHVVEQGAVCMNCHVGVPHGWKRPSLIVLVGDGAPYEVPGVSKIRSWTRRSGNYEDNNCSTATGCH